jgi:hypothetical protein
MGGINFGWLAVWGVSPDWLKPKRYASIIRRLGEEAAPAERGGGAGRAPSLHRYPGICLTTEEITENLSQSIRKALGRTEQNVIRIVDLAITGYGLDWPAGPCRPGFHRRRRGQPSVSLSICRVAVLGGSPRQLTLNQSSQSGLWCGRQTAEHPDPRLSACYLCTRGHQ